MLFDPKTEEQLQESELVPKGAYRYKIIKSEEKISHAGNEYIALQLKVWNDEGLEGLVFTNLALIKLLKHLCDVNNMQDEYKSGNVPAENLYGKSGGRVLIDIESEKPKPGGGTYRAKNIVTDYIVAPHGSLTAPLGNHTDVNVPFDDQLPF